MANFLRTSNLAKLLLIAVNFNLLLTIKYAHNLIIISFSLPCKNYQGTKTGAVASLQSVVNVACVAC